MEVYGKHIKPIVLRDLFDKIRKGKGLAGTPDRFIEDALRSYFEQNTRVLRLLSRAQTFGDVQKSADVNTVIKTMRALLRRHIGAFEEQFVHKPKKFLQEIEDYYDEESRDAHLAFLKKHPSTRERLDSLQSFVDVVFRHVGTNILSIGCGLDPLLFVFAPQKKYQLLACDLSTVVTSFLDQYFSVIAETSDIHGIARNVDISKETIAGEFDTVFAFKVFDLISHKRTEELLASITAKRWLCTFSKKTLTGKAMRYPKRGWFHLMLERRGWSYHIHEFPSETLYAVNTC